jgi:PAS domain-containing protein
MSAVSHGGHETAFASWARRTPKPASRLGRALARALRWGLPMPADFIREETITWDEPTDAHLSLASIIDRRFAAALAEVIGDDGGGTASLVVASRGNGQIIAMTCRDGLVGEVRELGALRDVVAGAHGDDLLDEAIAAALGPMASLEHAAVFRTDGARVGLVAVGHRDRKMSRTRAQAALVRGAAAVAGWIGSPDDVRLPVQALVEAIADATLVHDAGVIVMANAAAGRLLGLERPEIAIGRQLSHYLAASTSTPAAHRCLRIRREGEPVWIELREMPLLVGGRVRRAAILRELPPPERARPLPRVALGPLLELTVATLYPVLRQTGRVTMELCPRSRVIGDAKAIRDLASLALLEVASTLDPGHAPDNQLHVSIHDDGHEIVFEVSARGKAAGELAVGAEPLGIVACRTLAAAVGARLECDTSLLGRHVIVIRLPRHPGPEAA